MLGSKEEGHRLSFLYGNTLVRTYHLSPVGLEDSRMRELSQDPSSWMKEGPKFIEHVMEARSQTAKLFLKTRCS